LPTARLLALLLLLVVNAVAQGSPSAERSSAEVVGNSPGGGSSFAFASAASLPDAPSTHWVIDKKFIAVMAVLGGRKRCVSPLASWCWIMNSLPALPGSRAFLRTSIWSPSMRESSPRNCWLRMNSRSHTPGFRVTGSSESCGGLIPRAWRRSTSKTEWATFVPRAPEVALR
jgi:hypothetical protein